MREIIEVLKNIAGTQVRIYTDHKIYSPHFSFFYSHFRANEVFSPQTHKF